MSFPCNSLYINTISCNAATKIGFSKFAKIRPKECILAVESGTHAVYVCVCTVHQNTKLMMLDAKLAIITGGQFSQYRHCFSAIQCGTSFLLLMGREHVMGLKEQSNVLQLGQVSRDHTTIRS